MELTRRDRARAGFTMIEMVVSLFVSLIVVFAIGKLMLVNGTSLRQGRDRILLQQNVSEVLDRVCHSTRAARTLQVVSATQFRTYDADGTLKHTYRKWATASGDRLQEDGRDMSGQACTVFTCTPNADTTSVTLVMKFTNTDGETVDRRTRITVRNRTLSF